MRNSQWVRLALLLAAVLAALPAVQAQANIYIVNADPPGYGFNDTTPVAPVGGNPGTTLGVQRQYAFVAAADKWGGTLTSAVPIFIYAFWADLSCTATSAVLGSAGAYSVWRDFSGAPRTGTWYPQALANKIFGGDLSGGQTPDIIARFNNKLGQSGCLTGTFFYLGLDGNHGNDIDLVTVLEHEFAHGLGFQTFTNGSTGVQLGAPNPKPSIWDYYLFDTTTGKTWVQMTDTERAASALNSRRLVWNGATVTTDVPKVLGLGFPLLMVKSPAWVAGQYQVGTASFGPALSSPGVTGTVGAVVDQANGTGLACTPLSPANAATVQGRIALVDRGTCTFNIKAQNVQNAGAIGMIVVDNAPGSPPSGLGGTDPTITIPCVRVSQTDGNQLRAATRTGSRTNTGVVATLGVNMSQYSGADPLNRAMMYTPNPYQSGSSVSHWDTILTPNQLMEPAINGNLTHEVTVPKDLTFSLLRDIGW